MVPVRVVQMAINQIIHVIAMGNRRMPAVRSMNMPGSVFLDGKSGRATRRVFLADLDDVFIHMPLMRVMQMPIMQIIHMIAVFDRRMSAVRPVNVSVIGVCRASI